MAVKKFKYAELGKQLILARLEKAVWEEREILSSEVAKKLKISPAMMSSLERGRKLPGDDLLHRIVDYYGSFRGREIEDAFFELEFESEEKHADGG